MRMSAGNDWGNRPRAKEEMTQQTSRGALMFGVLVALAIVMSVSGLLVMWGVSILHDAGAIDWSLSFRQAQLLSLCVFLIQAMWRYLFLRKENTPT